MERNPSVGASRTVSLLPLFLRWYFVERPAHILRTFFTYLRALQESFSILFLMKTLFAPWKRIVDAYPQNWFNIRALTETFLFNTVTRLVGAVIRLMAIVTGVLLLLAVIVGFLAYFILWILFPLAFVAGIATSVVILFFP